MRLVVEMANGQVSIQMHTIETGARDLLRDNLDGLRQELAQMGLKSGSLDVSGGRDQGGRSFAQQFGFGDDGSGRGRDDGPRTAVDTIDVACWSSRARRVAMRLPDGQGVEVQGSLHRRFFSAGGGRASRYEVEAHTLRRVELP